MSHLEDQPGDVISMSAAESTSGPSCHDPSIFVIDRDSIRVKRIGLWLSDFGYRVVRTRIADISKSLPVQSPRIALVSTTNGRSFDANLISELRGFGFNVICYEDKALSWPLSAQAKVLLLGGRILLDSELPGFSTALSRDLRALIDQSAKDESRRSEAVKCMSKLGLIGSSDFVSRIFDWVSRVSNLTDCPVLITGETGTGKELLAKALHRLDPARSRGPLVAVNCASLTPDLVDNELFGHRRGAFTGATADRKGLVRTADHGILFLDEIGELDCANQTKLLRVLETNRVRGIGEDRDCSVDVRVIAATNRDLEEMIAQGTFRADLYYRLNVVSMHLPPLRERIDDVDDLSHHFVEKYRSSNSPFQTIHDSFFEALKRCNWPGNIRQLENVVRETLVLNFDCNEITWQHLPHEILAIIAEDSDAALPNCDELMADGEPRDPVGAATNALNALFGNEGWDLKKCMRLCERIILRQALTRGNNNQTEAARLLGITSRSVYNKLRKHQLAD